MLPCTLMSGKIPSTFIQELLNRTDIVTVIEQHLSLKKSGNSYKALCPFHHEKTPSFIVSATKQIYHCFGCGKSGNAVSFLMEYEHMTFPEAIEALAAQAGLEVSYEKGQMRRTEENSESLDELYSIMTAAMKFYHHELMYSKEAEPARNYLAARGLHKKTIVQFSIGYAKPLWSALIEKLGKTSQHRDTLLKAGLIIEKDGSHYDRFRNRIMIPICDRRGRVIAFGGRVLDDSTPKYLNSPETPIFHKSDHLYGWHEMRTSNPKVEHILLVEGYMDVIALFEHGISYAVATLGTATSQTQLQQLFRLTPEIIFCFDGDAAGIAAATRAFEQLLPLMQDDFQPKFLFLPENEDPDSLVRKEGKSNFERRFASAISFSVFFLNQLRENIDLTTLEGRAKLASRASEYLEKLPAPALRALIASEIEKITKLSRDHFVSDAPNNHGDIDIDHEILRKRSSSIRFALTALIQRPTLIRHIEFNNLNDDIDLPGFALLKAIASHLDSLDYEQLETLSTAMLLEYWRDHQNFSILAKLATQELLIPESGIVHELRDALKAIRGQALQTKIDYLIQKANQSALTDSEKQDLQALLQAKQQER